MRRVSNNLNIMILIFDDFPITPVLQKDGSVLKISLAMPGRLVAIQVWQASIGRVTLYLLDTNVPENNEHDRDITHRLYGG